MLLMCQAVGLVLGIEIQEWDNIDSEGVYVLLNNKKTLSPDCIPVPSLSAKKVPAF